MRSCALRNRLTSSTTTGAIINNINNINNNNNNNINNTSHYTPQPSLLPHAPHHVYTQSRTITCAAFAASVAKAHADFASKKTRDAQVYGTNLFEIEVLDDINLTPVITPTAEPVTMEKEEAATPTTTGKKTPKGKGKKKNDNNNNNNNNNNNKELAPPEPAAPTSGMTPVLAMQIANAASALRIKPVTGSAFTDTISWALRPDVVATMPSEPLSRLLHTGVILHAPQLSELLMMYLWRVVELSPTMSPVVCAVIINAYGRGGIQHRILYEALGKRAIETIKDPSITMAHVANVSYGLSKVGYNNKELYLKLRDQSIRMKANVSPLIVASILDSFSTVGFIEDELFDAYGEILMKNLSTCSAPLITSLIGTFTKANRKSSELLFTACRKRAVDIAGNFDSSSIARAMDNMYKADITDEDMMAALSERACKIPVDFRVVEVRQVLESLAHFSLYDPELFPLLGSRVASIIRSRGVYDLDNIAAILAAFASVHERHEDLISVGSKVLSESALSMSPATYINTLYAFTIHNVRNEPLKKAIAGASKQRGLMAAEAQRSPVMKKRYAEIRW